MRDKGSPKRPPRLTYIEKYAFENLPVEIGSLEKRIALLEVSLSDPTLFISDPGKFKESAEELNQLKLIRDEKELEWFKLVEKADEVEI